MSTTAFTVLVVEDEAPILENIVQKIERLPLPLKVIATAQDGEEACEKIKKYRPHIVLTDIQMPGMDGLKLCKYINETSPQIKIVVVSGYGEFEYAQKAIAYQVCSYLLKPVNVEKLLETMQAICGDLSAQHRTKDRDIISSHLFGNTANSELLCSYEGEPFGIYLICLGNFLENDYDAVDLEKTRELWKIAGIAEILAEHCNEQQTWWLVGEKHPNQIILITSFFDSNLVNILYEKIKYNLRESCHFTICTFPNFITFSAIWQSAQQLRNNMHNLLVPCKSNCFFETKKLACVLNKSCNDLLQAVLHCIKVGQFAQYKSSMALLLSELQKGNTTQLLLKEVLENITNALVCADNENAFDKFKFEEYLNNTFLICTDQNDLYNNLLKIIINASCAVFPAFESSDSLAPAIKKYIDQNYHADISVDTIAAIFHFSVSYISRVFKKEYKVPPFKYLLNLRIEEAKRLIRENDELNIGLVSEMVGYPDQHYFSRIFRSTTGLSPSEYKKSVMF